MIYIHVYPIADLREHVIDGTDCWCHPTVNEDDGVVTHHSMDQREAYEEGRKPS